MIDRTPQGGQGQAGDQMMMNVGQQNLMTMERYPWPRMLSRSQMRQVMPQGQPGMGPRRMQGQTAMGQPTMRTPGMGYEAPPRRLKRSRAMTERETMMLMEEWNKPHDPNEVRKWPWDGHYEFNATQDEMAKSQYIWPLHAELIPRMPKPSFIIDWNLLESEYDRSFLYSETQIILIMGMSVTGTWTLRLERSVLRAWPSF